MGTNSVEDRRHGVRVKRVIAIRHRLYKRNRKISEGEWTLSTTEDMSISGILFVSPNEYKSDDIIQLEVKLSGILDIFNGYAKVVRVVEKKRPKLHHIAVTFVNIKPRRSAKRF